LRSSGNSPDNEIGRETVFGFQVIIAKALQLKFILDLIFFSNIKNIIATGCKATQRFKQNVCCFFINLEFAFDCFY